MSDIIEDNAGLMLSSKKGGMRYLLNRESVGARGYIYIDGEKYARMGANFNYDLQTGQIINFSNDRMPGCGKGLFEIAVITVRAKDILAYENINPFAKIVNVIYTDNPSESAKAVINASLIEYNIAVEACNAPILKAIKSAA